MDSPVTPATGRSAQLNVDWGEIDTVILDMDGTLLDLHYDNKVWNEIVPRAYADAQQIAYEDAQQHLLTHMRAIYGTIEFYNIEYWNDYTGLDLVGLHRVAKHLVRLRPAAREFLLWLRESARHVVIATNAHPYSLMVKAEVIDLAAMVDVVISSHHIGAPKENQRFWHGLRDNVSFDPARSLFVDDNEPVLRAAEAYGIAHNLTISTPDSHRPARPDLRYACFDSFREIMPA